MSAEDEAARKAAEDPRLTACIDLARRCGAHAFHLRWSDDEEPTVWMAVAEIKHRGDGYPAKTGHLTAWEVGAAMLPADAAMRLCEALSEAAVCRHCGRPTGVATDWQNEQPLADHICWYVFDPETAKFRRSCEGDVPTRGRNDPCFCGSGKKFKRCHGA